MSDDRAAAWTAAPQFASLPEPGPVLWATVWRDGRRVGAVWTAATDTGRPRAGIVLADGLTDDLIQDDLGVATLAFSSDPARVPAAEFMDGLMASRNGSYGRLSVDRASSAPDLLTVRRLMGQNL